MTKLRIVLSLVALLALLGCSGPGDSGKDHATAPRADKPRVNDPANYGKNGKPDLTSPGQRRAVE